MKVTKSSGSVLFPLITGSFPICPFIVLDYTAAKIPVITDDCYIQQHLKFKVIK